MLGLAFTLLVHSIPSLGIDVGLAIGSDMDTELALDELVVILRYMLLLYFGTLKVSLVAHK